MLFKNSEMLNNSAVPYAVDFGRTVLKKMLKVKRKTINGILNAKIYPMLW